VILLIGFPPGLSPEQAAGTLAAGNFSAGIAANRVRVISPQAQTEPDYF